MFFFFGTRFHGALRYLALLRLNFLNAQLTWEEESSHGGNQGKNSHGGGDPFEASELQTRPAKQDRGPQRQCEHGRADPEGGWRHHGQRGQVRAPVDTRSHYDNAEMNTWLIYMFIVLNNMRDYSRTRFTVAVHGNTMILVDYRVYIGYFHDTCPKHHEALELLKLDCCLKTSDLRMNYELQWQSWLPQ